MSGLFLIIPGDQHSSSFDVAGKAALQRNLDLVGTLSEYTRLRTACETRLSAGLGSRAELSFSPPPGLYD
jgi:hypothetical protein